MSTKKKGKEARKKAEKEKTIDSKPIDEITAFFPAYNEEENIPICMNNAKKVLEKYAEKWEILAVVAEASTDKTIEIINEYNKLDPRIKLVLQPKNRAGVGAAYKIGFEKAQYNKIFYADADNQFDLEELSTFVPHLEEYDIIAGVRAERHDPVGRLFAAKVYNFLLRTTFNTKIQDFDCAFRLVKKSVFEKVNIAASSGLMTAETMIKAEKAGCKIKQVPVKHFERTLGATRFSTPLANLPKAKVVWEIIQEIRRLKKEVDRKEESNKKEEDQKDKGKEENNKKESEKKETNDKDAETANEIEKQ